jgi:hypothetical protein
MASWDLPNTDSFDVEEACNGEMRRQRLASRRRWRGGSVLMPSRPCVTSSVRRPGGSMQAWLPHGSHQAPAARHCIIAETARQRCPGTVDGKKKGITRKGESDLNTESLLVSPPFRKSSIFFRVLLKL